MPDDRRRYEYLFDQFYLTIFNEGICVYCGELGTERDHFVPITKAAGITTGLYVLPACKDCNVKAGNRLFKTFEDKLKFIHEKIAEANKAFLKLPEWTEEELEELGWTMRNDVCYGLKRKQRTLLRLGWKNSLNPEHAFIAGIGLSEEDFGSSTAVPSADSSTTETKEYQLLSRGELERKRAIDKEFEINIKEEYGYGAWEILNNVKG